MKTGHRMLRTAATILAMGATVSVGMTSAQASSGSPSTIGHSNPETQGFSFAYADAGMYGGPGYSKDEIDVYTNNGGAPIQAFKTTAEQRQAYGGSNTLAYVSTSTQACLVLASITTGRNGPGEWESFTVDQSTGLIGAEVSRVLDAGGSGLTAYSGYPEDVVAGKSGTFVIGADATNSIEELNVGPGCVLGPIIRAAGTPSDAIYYNVALVGSHSAVAGDYAHNTVDTFSIKPYTLVSTAAAVAPKVSGLAVVGTTVATGTVGLNQVETGTSAAPGGITWGGTATDPFNGYSTYEVALTSNCVFGVDAGFSPIFAWYTISGSPPIPTFQDTTPAPNRVTRVNVMVPVGFHLFMVGNQTIYNSVIGTNCQLAFGFFASLPVKAQEPNGLAFH